MAGKHEHQWANANHLNLALTGNSPKEIRKNNYYQCQICGKMKKEYRGISRFADLANKGNELATRRKAKEWTPSKGVGWKPPTPKDIASLPKPNKNQMMAGSNPEPDFSKPNSSKRASQPVTISPTESQEKTGWRKSKKSWRKRKAKASHVVRDKQGNVKLSLEPEDISREGKMPAKYRIEDMLLMNPHSRVSGIKRQLKQEGYSDYQIEKAVRENPIIGGEAKHPITGKRIRSFKFTCPYCHMEMRNTEYAQHAVDFHRDQISYLRGEHHQLGIMGELKNDIREMHSKLLSMSESMNGLQKQGDESEEPDQKAGFIREFDRLKTGYGITERRYKQAIREYKKLHEKGMEDQQRSKWLLENTAKISIIESITERQKILDERKKSKMSPDAASARAKKAWQSRQRSKQDAGQQRSDVMGGKTAFPKHAKRDDPQDDPFKQRSRKIKTKTKSKNWSNMKKRAGAWWQSMKPDQRAELMDKMPDVHSWYRAKEPTRQKGEPWQYNVHAGKGQFSKQDMVHLDFHEMKIMLQSRIVKAYQGLRQNARHDRDEAIRHFGNFQGVNGHAEIWRDKSIDAGHPISMKMAQKYTKMSWDRLPRKIKRHYTHSMNDSWNRGTVLPVKKIQKRWQGL